MSLFTELDNLRKSHGSLRAIITYGDNFLSYLLGKKRWRGPMYLSWNITYQCDCDCIYCSAGKKTSAGEGEIKTEQVIDVLKQAGKSGTASICFTGGEPLLRPDIFKLLLAAKENKLRININTNGILLEKFAQDLIKIGVDSITVAMDSANPDICDKIKNYPNAFKLAEVGIKKLKSIRKGKKPLIEIRTVISKENYKVLDQVIDYWQDKVDKIWLQPIHHGVETCLHNVNYQNIDMLEINPEEFSKKFKELQKKYKFLQTSYYDEFPAFFKDKQTLKKRFRCFGGTFNLKLNPYGKAYPCARMICQVGNITESSLMEIWNGNELNKVRHLFKEEKNNCVCWTNDILPSFYLNRILKVFKLNQ